MMPRLMKTVIKHKGMHVYVCTYMVMHFRLNFSTKFKQYVSDIIDIKTLYINIYTFSFFLFIIYEKDVLGTKLAFGPSREGGGR
jgi:hypothetical protein